MPKHNPKKTEECAEFEKVVDFQIQGLQDDLREKDLEIERLKAQVEGLRLALAAKPVYYPAPVYPSRPYYPPTYPTITYTVGGTVSSSDVKLRTINGGRTA